MGLNLTYPSLKVFNSNKQTNKPEGNEFYGWPHLISKKLRDNEWNDDTTLIKTRHVISATAKLRT